MSDDLIIKLKETFSPKEKTRLSIVEKLQEKYLDLSENVTHIFNRDDIHTTIDIVYHSLIKFRFQKIEIEKSHVEALIIGDTRTGKSVTAKKLINHYKMGEMINCEKATIPGLIGGTFDMGSRKILTWGVIPRNDRRIVILDEADGIDTDTISNLSGIRSSCIAERTIAGGTRKTLARTRLLWLANPRGFRSISEYTSGVEAVKTLIGKPEDIARFDFCVAVSQNDVPIDIINKSNDEEFEHNFTSELCNKLLLFTWSRKEENVSFTGEAVDMILKYAVAFGKLFSSDIPIVHPNEQRIKLARISASIAAMMFSTTDGKNIIIEKHHVEFAAQFLMDIFNSEALGYHYYSKNKMLETTIDNQDDIEQKIIYGFESVMYSEYSNLYFVKKLLESGKLTFDDIQDALQTGDRELVRKVRQLLLINRCIKKRYTFWECTEQFRVFLRSLQVKIERMVK